MTIGSIADRIEDAKKAATDPVYREKMLEEYNESVAKMNKGLAWRH